MSIKLCPKCGKEEEFYDNCKKCNRCSKCYKKYYYDNIEKYKEYRRINEDKLKEKGKEYRKNNLERLIKYAKDKYNSLTKEEKKIFNEKIQIAYKNSPERIKKHHEATKKWKNENRKKVNVKRNERRKVRYETDINYRIEVLLRTRLYKAVKRYKMKSALLLVGCSSEELKIYLEGKFKPEMDWSNFGKVWEIDHIIPVNSFDLSIEENQHKCFHFSNLQPLFKTTAIANSFGYNEIGNMNKRNKIINYEIKN